MTVKLKVLHGKLKGKGGSDTQDVVINKHRFVIGGAEDCQMRCPSDSISPHHCEILVENAEVKLRDLGSEKGTFLNDERVDDVRSLQSGDRLRVGRLEFEVAIKPGVKEVRERKSDPVGELVSDLLAEADEEERATRIADPRLRQFNLEKTQKEAPVEEPEPEDRETALRKKLPPKGKPAKLPKQPSFTADDTVSAAEETLKKIFEKPKPKKRPEQ